MRIDPESELAKFVPYSTHVHPQVLRTVEGDYLLCFQLQGMPFVGREPQDLAHKHHTFNKLLQTLRAPDYTHVAYWTHDIRRHKPLELPGQYPARFNQLLNDHYAQQLNSKRLLVNELYFTLIYRPQGGERATQRMFSADIASLELQQIEQVAKVLELASIVESTLYDYSPRRLGTYTANNGLVFSHPLEFLSYLINRSTDPVPVLSSRIFNYLPTGRQVFNEDNGNFMQETADGVRHYGCMLALRDYPEGTYPGLLNGLKELPHEYVLTHSFTPSARQAALTYLQRTKGRMLATGDKAVSQLLQTPLAELEHEVVALQQVVEVDRLPVIGAARRPVDIGQPAIRRTQHISLGLVEQARPSRRLHRDTVLFERVDEGTAEPVVYMIDRYVVGGFYRVHAERGIDEVLSAPGSSYVPLAFAPQLGLGFWAAMGAGTALAAATTAVGLFFLN